ncbi:hypothetical protein [Erwinia tasmaniensis]|uniref:Membrane protein n=1 Tax=Erwinia tasmaniensis (strain DSM 17950 / CFBP 7177 / CIP 109463 / NCPPB 4357 / Et1/99) TaxID=465817 RepID=B2VCR1_ERWT9|nr:hypothetical protein [Erwinia tasmaniensis]CAO98078.1 Putative membrane protein [Erwinia tasmaniensis Et1/99]
MHEAHSWLSNLLAILMAPLTIWFLYYWCRGDKASDLENEGMKKISTRPFFFSSLGIYSDDYFFDDESLIQVRKKKEILKVALFDIVRVRPENTRINNRRVWSVRYRLQGAEKEIRLIHNLTFFNRHFLDFLAAVKKASPGVEVKDTGLFRF